MSKSSKPTNDWDKIWQEYSKVLEKWKEVFETFQNTTMEMQKKYNEVMGIAANESSKDTMKQFGESWQKAMSQSGMESATSQGEMRSKGAEPPPATPASRTTKI